ncbi:MAG: penicillin-binding protein 2 [Polyangiaceae bacterium]
MSDLLVPRADVGEFRKRYAWLSLAVFVAFLAVVVRLFQLQILEGKSYAAIAHENVVRRVNLATTRGVIRDAQGKILASSRPSYNVYIVPGRALPSARPKKKAAGETADTDAWPKIAETLRLNPSERTYFENRMRNACTSEDDKSPCWRSILVREDVARDIVAELRQHQAELAGAEVVTTPVRYYPFKHLGAHMIGYVAEIDAETLAKVRPSGYESMRSDERQRVNPLGYEVGDSIGATGVEHAWETNLRGQRGWEKRVVDARGRIRTGPAAERLLDPPHSEDPIPGRDLRLTVDMDLEAVVEKAMRPHPAGSVVVVEAKTGRLLALYSKPDYDPNDLAGGGGRAHPRSVKQLEADPLRPMLDKTTSGAFHPGSTFKPFAAIAALEDGLMNPDDSERCDGALLFGRRLFRCTHVHGKVNMKDAIGESCNVYFFKLAEAVGMDRIARVANDFGFGAKTGIGVNPESAGRITTRSWYSLRYRGQFRIGFTLNTAIGQGDTTVTPLQLALAYAALGNGGTLYSPSLVRSMETGDGTVVQDFEPRVKRQVAVKPENMARILDGLTAVVNDPKGTAYPVRDPSLDMAGKTGTAQTGYVARDEDDAKMQWYYSREHAWFAAFSPAKSPEIAVVVLVEHGGSGPTQAAPVAVSVVREYQKLMAARAAKPAPKRDPGAPR